MIYIGIDPGQKCGVATVDESGNRASSVIPLTSLGSYFQALGQDRVIVFVEKAATRRKIWTRLREHLANANAVIRAVKAQWPRRNKVYTLDPKVWQLGMLHRAPGKDTKARSVLVAGQIMGREIKDHNEADAVCILEYGRVSKVKKTS